MQELSLALDVDVSPINNERSLLAIASLTEYFRNLIARWRTHPYPQDNVIGILIQAQAESKLSEDELLAQCTLMLLAANLSTKQLIGSGVLALLRHPDQLRLLQTKPALIQLAIDE